MVEELTIADALTELKRIKKILAVRAQNITRYSSKRKGGRDEIEKQRKFIDGEFQSAKDLITRYEDIKLAINASNLETMITFEEDTFSVANAILFKQQFYEMNMGILNAFSQNTGKRQVNEYARTINLSGNMTQEQLEKLDLIPELLYDEKEIIGAREQQLSLYSFIDALIEKSNHNTQISV